MSRKRIDLPEPTILDKAIGWVSPETGVRRLKARAVMALYGGYNAARKDRRQTKYWQTSEGSANTVTLPDLPTLRDRSRDLIRNAPLAAGAVNTVVTNVVGTGLMVQSRIDRDVLKGVLGETEDEFDAFERAAEREFRLWAESQNCDASRTQNFMGLQDLALRSTLESGDVFVLKTFIERPGWPLATTLQLIEADRICNPDGKTDTPYLSGGVEIDTYGAPIAYHVLKAHPDDVIDKRSRESLRVTAYGRIIRGKCCIYSRACVLALCAAFLTWLRSLKVLSNWINTRKPKLWLPLFRRCSRSLLKVKILTGFLP